MTTSTDQAERPWAAPFFTIWIGQALSLVGSRVGGFALTWWLTRTSGSATILATATMVMMIPHVFLGPIAGALVDRWNRRRTMIVADSAIAALSALLAYLFWIDSLQIWHVYVIMFLRALGGAFHSPAMQASTSLMVPKDQLTRIGGMNQTLQGIMGVVTPPLGALLMELLPLHTIMIVDVVTAAFAIGPLFFIDIPQPVREAAPEPGEKALGAPPSVWQDVVDGFRYLWNWKGMFMVLMLATVINAMIHPAMSLLPVMVQNYFKGGALQLGWLNSAWGIGMIAGGLILSAWGGLKSKVLTALLALIGQGLGFVVIGLTPSEAFWLSIAGMAFSGMTNPIVNGPFFALFQDVVAPELQGRVFTVLSSLTALAAPLGLAVAGPVADWLGVQVWFVIGGLVCILASVVMLSTPAVMNLESHGHAVQAARNTAPEQPA
jgi:DHA3 family macrolide efflux protein-like MFS transporter